MSTSDFKDYFSGQSGQYAKNRPTYPASLIDFIVSHVSAYETAWDCATGNGQVALALAGHFKSVIATDASKEQLEQAIPHPSIQYIQSRAESTSIASSSIDLITVATALHWFNFNSFFKEVDRVIKQEGFFAAWGYGSVSVNYEIDPYIHDFYRNLIGPYWPAERIFMDQHYDTIPFPFPLIETPPFKMEQSWSVDRFLGYVESWSACQNYRKTHGKSPISYLRHNLVPLWKQEKMTISWQLFLKCGYPKKK